MQSDEQLMGQFRGGSTQAFEELFHRYRNLVYGFFQRRLNQPARAEEMAQETFLVVLRRAEAYEPRATFRAYLFGIAIKQLWSERRKEMRESKGVREAARETPHSVPANDPSATLWIRGALERLDPAYREVLMLREYEQLSYDDIADALGIPVNTVRSRLFRARAELKALLDERAVEEASR
jgi:RNA polymerase sigma-70 factor (ECF subfamily)